VFKVFSESDREHFELFAELDQRECTSERGSLCFVFGTQNLVIGKLRRLAGSPEDAAAAKRFVSACKEVAGHDRLATIRAKHESVTPSSTKPCFSHLRFYDYCRRLLDLDLSAQELDGALKEAESLKIFGKKFDKMRPKSSEQSVTEAAVQCAKMNLDSVRQDYRKLLENRLAGLREDCLVLFSANNNLIWMHEHMHDLWGLEGSSRQLPETERNLRYLEECRQLGKLENKEIMKAAGMGEDAERKSCKLFGNVWNFFGS
jgi:hypothetical protein